jgi:hypothetical protein
MFTRFLGRMADVSFAEAGSGATLMILNGRFTVKYGGRDGGRRVLHDG